MWNAFATSERCTRPIERRGCLGSDLLIIDRRICQPAGQRIEHDFHNVHDGRDLIRRKVIQQALGVFSICVHGRIRLMPQH